MKRPSFQFYPADWRKDTALQSCSIGARGLWHEMICIMHECIPYGHLEVHGAPILPTELARLVGISRSKCVRFLTELETKMVFFRTEKRTIFCKRMVEDEKLRNIRSEAGKLGGNPNLKHPLLLNQKVNLPPNQSPTPSSSSSSSSSSSFNKSSNEDLKFPKKGIQAKPVAERKENKEITNMLLALKQMIKIDAFADTKLERFMARHCIRLIGKIGPVEFRRRLELILQDTFKRKNCNRIKYLYGELNAWIEPQQQSRHVNVDDLVRKMSNTNPSPPTQ